jgi:hypothetical protein
VGGTAPARLVKPLACREAIAAEHLQETASAASRAVVRPESDDSAARARTTRDPDAACACCLDPDGARTHATPTTTGSNCEWARLPRRSRQSPRSPRSGRAASKPLSRCSASSVPALHMDRNSHAGTSTTCRRFVSGAPLKTFSALRRVGGLNPPSAPTSPVPPGFQKPGRPSRGIWLGGNSSASTRRGCVFV